MPEPTKTELAFSDAYEAALESHRAYSEDCADVFSCTDEALAGQANAWRAMQRAARQLLTDDDVYDMRDACYGREPGTNRRCKCIDPDTVELCNRALDDNDPEARYELWIQRLPR